MSECRSGVRRDGDFAAESETDEVAGDGAPVAGALSPSRHLTVYPAGTWNSEASGSLRLMFVRR